MRAAAVRDEIARLGRTLEAAGLLDLTAGNISARIDADALAITPSGIPYGDTGAEDVVVCALEDGAVLDGARRPSSELPLHRAIYAARPDAGAVVHTHSPYATTFAVLREPIPAVHYAIARLRTAEVPVVDYATYGSDELARLAFGVLGDGARAALLANHGAVALGADLAEAGRNARVLETLAATFWRARAIGLPHVLPADEIARVERRYETYGQPRGAER
jgi:ribulose-5-phosphate 4-epimerase/fuculose-1-phosphate aldolase